MLSQITQSFQVVVQILDVVPVPAYLLQRDGTVAYMNESARATSPLLPADVAACAHRSDESVRSGMLRWTRVHVEGQPLMLVVSSRETPRGLGLPIVLSPRLGSVAGLLVDGRTEKEIAVELRLTYASVRTYVQQIYRKLRVHNRVGLVTMFRRA